MKKMLWLAFLTQLLWPAAQSFAQSNGTVAIRLAWEQMFVAAVPLAFALIYFFLYLFYPRSREFLYFAVTVAAVAVSNFLNYQTETQAITVGIRVTTVIGLTFGLRFMYALFYKKVPAQFYVLTFLLTGLGIAVLLYPRSSSSPVVFLIFMACSLELLRALATAIYRKREGAWILGVGFIILLAVGVYEQMMDIFHFTPIGGIDNPGVQASLATMIAMAVYLARRFARANMDLETRSHELQRLNVELEDRVARRTEELAAANKNLEKQNLELENSRDEIERAHGELQETYKELQQTQTRLVQSEKMASLGDLAAGVAHEINSPVGAVSSAADTSRRLIDRIMGAGNEKDIKEALNVLKSNNDVVTMAAGRVSDIVESLRNFARLDEAVFQEADIHEGLDSTLTLLHHEMKSRIDVIKEYGDVPRIRCYPNQLNQVFMNVLRNAVQAIESRGTIRIRTEKKDSNVTVAISDDGCGIKKEHLGKIFDPGFTTKGVRVGMGLGLSISHNIISDHGGTIEATSEEGRGTEFVITLPIGGPPGGGSPSRR